MPSFIILFYIFDCSLSTPLFIYQQQQQHPSPFNCQLIQGTPFFRRFFPYDKIHQPFHFLLITLPSLILPFLLFLSIIISLFFLLSPASLSLLCFSLFFVYFVILVFFPSNFLFLFFLWFARPSPYSFPFFFHHSLPFSLPTPFRLTSLFSSDARFFLLNRSPATNNHSIIDSQSSA